MLFVCTIRDYQWETQRVRSAKTTPIVDVKYSGTSPQSLIDLSSTVIYGSGIHNIHTHQSWHYSVCSVAFHDQYRTTSQVGHLRLKLNDIVPKLYLLLLS